jgi:hypothetical protein
MQAMIVHHHLVKVFHQQWTLALMTQMMVHKEEEEYAKVIEDFLHLPQGDVEDNPIQRLTQTKLYNISDVSTLSTLLLLLNLQAKYGWNDTSVNALFK